MEPTINRLFINLKKIREKRKLTQADIAVAIGYELISSVSHVEAGRKNIKSEALLHWLSILDIDLINLTDAIVKEKLDLSLINKAIENNININYLIKKELDLNE